MFREYGTTLTRRLMSEIFKIPKIVPVNKKHCVTIDGEQHEVTLDKKLEVLQHGEENFMWKDNKLVLKPKPRSKTVHPVLKQAEKGYFFEQQDIHWPSDIGKGGLAWQIESE